MTIQTKPNLTDKPAQSLIRNPFKYISRNEALAPLTMPDADLEVATINRSLYDGDHWLDGAGWMGPIPSTDDHTYADVKEEIRRVFASRNIVKEVVDRKIDGLLKTKPRTDFVRRKPVTDEAPLSPDDEKLIDEATTLFLEWAEERKLLKLLKEVYGRSEIGEYVVVRLYIPRGYLIRRADGSTGLPTGLTVKQYMDMIHVNLIVNGVAGEIIDEDTQLKAMVNEIAKGGKRITEIVYVDGEDTVIRTLADTHSDTIVIVRSPEEQAMRDADLGTEWRLRMGRRNTMFMPRLRNIISQQVRENQYAVNLSKTLQNRNMVTAGFLERILLDAMPPGKWVPNPDKEGEEMFEVGPFKIGSGTTNFFMAAEYREQDEQGEMRTRYGNPQVYFRDPADPEVFIKSKRDCYQDILEEVGQPDKLISGDATSSGLSREQAREIFASTLEDDEGELNPLVVWFMETPLAMATALAGKPDYFATLKAEAECFINTGPLTGTERQDLRENVKAGLLSRKTAMRRDGVEAPQTEFDQMSTEEDEFDIALQRKANIVQVLVAAGSSLKGACELVGIDAALAAKLIETDFPEGDPRNPVDPNAPKDPAQPDPTKPEDKPKPKADPKPEAK